MRNINSNAAELTPRALVTPTAAILESPVAGKTERGVTPRVVLLSLALAFLFGYIIPVIDIKLNNTYLASVHLPPGAVAVLLVLLLVVNPILKLIARGLAFSRNEILTVYIACLFSCLVPGHGAENFFVSNLIGPFYYATRENKWLEFLPRYLKPWFTPALSDHGQYGPSSRSVVEPWYTALVKGHAIPWSAWIIPLFAWGLFICALYTMLACLSVMLRAQWAEHEALAFPLLRLPLELTEDVDRPDQYGVLGRFFRNPLMWIGFGIAVFISLLTGLNVYYPDVPPVPLDINTGPLFTEAPWNQISPTLIRTLPMLVGITYLLTSEVSFSLWFFNWLIKAQLIVAYYLGFLPSTLPNAIGHTGDAKSFTGYQQVGCYLAYVGVVLWTGREHFRHIVRRAFRREQAGENEQQEALSYPVAFWGFILAFAFILAWSVAAGMRLDVAIVLWLSYLIIALSLTRVVVEGGLYYAQQGWTPLGTIAQLTNSGPGKWLSPESIVPGTFLQGAIITDMRAFLMPSFLQSFKLAYDHKIAARPLLALIAAVTGITLTMGLWMRVRMGYESGGLQLNQWFAVVGAQQPAVNSVQFINGARDVSWTNWLWLGLGMLTTYGIMLARSRWMWFPLHPIGFLMCLTAPLHRVWFSIFLGWLCKVLITRFGGTDTYRKMVPAFLGLALGDIAMMLFWLIIDGWQGRTGHQLMPG
ncbi:MAG: hypothetical protein JO316_25160 [Abitibacteriaceae bacterium]|nr:hypothetical protein [Abditibacteriaceae bacterium]